jgi:hypothetical protein
MHLRSSGARWVSRAAEELEFARTAPEGVLALFGCRTTLGVGGIKLENPGD